MRSTGKVSGLGVVDLFSEPYKEEDAYVEDSDTASMSQLSWDSSLRDDGNESVSTVESSSSSETKSSKKSWAKANVKAHVKPWKDKKVKKELREKSDELDAERRAHRALEEQFVGMKLVVAKAKKKELREKSDELDAERRAHRALEEQFVGMKLVVAKAEEEKEELLDSLQKARYERDLARVTAENEIYQLMERLKESETKRKELEAKLQQLEDQSNRTKKRPSKGPGILRGSVDIASRRWRFARRNPNSAQGPTVPVDCIAE
eukprot:CAMPEP_0197464356 /NCGR_PEP_ID=MMETSP1175-20131217/63980_1 /TAXON_ID=1003142 /ORGANISM="Triceratium dubium, Strain CCMP147" /LENGTH=262 /DNA_ID=CAMNT_0043000335 /DNA_START=293 /DNA_END=1085 /DNA_ORIENTATION=+